MGEKWKRYQIYFLGLQNYRSDYSHKIKRRLLLGRRAMTKLDSVLKSRDITLLTMVCLVKAMVFPAVMYGCESWAIKKSEQLRIDSFKLWYWKRLLRVPWTSRRSNQSILKEINHEYSLEGLMAAYSSILAWRIPWTEEPGGLQSMGWQRAGHDRVTNTFTFGLPW